MQQTMKTAHALSGYMHKEAPRSKRYMIPFLYTSLLVTLVSSICTTIAECLRDTDLFLPTHWLIICSS